MLCPTQAAGGWVGISVRGNYAVKLLPGAPPKPLLLGWELLRSSYGVKLLVISINQPTTMTKRRSL